MSVLLPIILAAIDADQVTPGWVGFAITAGFMIVAILLVMDMVRRMRRLRYREEAREKIAAEIGADVTEAELDSADDSKPG